MKRRIPQTECTPPRKIRKIDYVKLARKSGEDAYTSVKEAGLPEEIALTFRKVFGTPVEPEFRIS